MSRKTVIATGLLISITLLASCTLTKHEDQQQLCTKMKREWTYQTQNLNHEAAWTTRYQKDQFKQKMHENNCQ